MPKYTKELTVTLGSGKRATREMLIVTSVDNHYGMDADGNRGVRMEFLDDIRPLVPFKDDPLVDDNGELLSESESLEAITLLDQAAEIADLDC